MRKKQRNSAPKAFKDTLKNCTRTDLMEIIWDMMLRFDDSAFESHDPKIIGEQVLEILKAIREEQS